MEWKCWEAQTACREGGVLSSLTCNSDRPSVYLSLKVVWWWCLFPHMQGFGENGRQFIPRLCFSKILNQVEISLRTLIPLFMPGLVHSGSASLDDCKRMFPDELRVSSFSDGFLHYAWTVVVSPQQLRWVKGVCVLRCNLPTALLAE